MLAWVHWNAAIAGAHGRGGEWELTSEPGVRSVLVRRLPFSVSCIEGCVWVTHDADPGDHVLGPGQVFTASGPGLLVLWAFEPSRLLVLGRGWRMSRYLAATSFRDLTASALQGIQAR
jgi:hypothetical protein